MTNEIGTCARCGGRVLRVIYGFPMLDDSMEVGVNVLLGGCCIVPGSPVRRCEDCGQGEGSVESSGLGAAHIDLLRELG